MRPDFISRFTPSMMSPDTLEAMFVQREALAQRLVGLVKESVLTAGKHHVLLIGPRGIGKTHLIALVCHRVLALGELRERLLVAWLREEEWEITSFLDFLIRVLRTLADSCGDPGLEERIEALSDLGAKPAEDAAAALLREVVGRHSLLVAMENADQVFANLGDVGQKRLRAYVQDTPLFAMLWSAQSLFNGVRLHTSPFYGFFHIEHLQGLTLGDAVSLLGRIAEYRGRSDLAAFIASPAGRARVRAVHHLAGGVHRVYVIFADFLSRDSLDQLVDAFLHVLDELTPYYHARMQQLSPQQRKIAAFLSEQRGAAAVKTIARACHISPQTAASQLKVLSDKGYVTATRLGSARLCASNTSRPFCNVR
jgi:DNA-binding transcriptional ArsR family regulator